MSYPPSFYDAVAAEYGERWTIEEEVRRGAAMLAADAPRVIEIACGNGRLLRNLPPTAVGVDFSPAMLALAARRAPAALLVRADARSLPFRKIGGWTVVAVNVLHNQPDPGAFLHELARAGAERIVTDFRNRWNPIVLMKDLLRQRSKAISYAAITPGAMARLLRRAGFTPRRRRAIRRPLSDPAEGFRVRHLIGALISLLPGFAPCYTLEAMKTIKKLSK